MTNLKNPTDKEYIALILERVGVNQDINSIIEYKSGYQSKGYRVDLKNKTSLFIKRAHARGLGFEVPERIQMNFQISSRMASRYQSGPKILGNVLVENHKARKLGDFDQHTDLFQVIEFEPDGKSYWDILQQKQNKQYIDQQYIDQQDRAEIDKVIAYLVGLHAIKPEFSDSEYCKQVYNDAQRSILTDPELGMAFLQDFNFDHPFLPLDKQTQYLGLIYENIRKNENNYSRICALHGDFWGANVFFREDKSIWVIDQSRIPWGEPGIDVGWWLGQYLWFYHKTRNSYFKNLGDYFLTEYETHTKDTNIRRTVCLVLGLMGLINTSPRFYPNLDNNLATQYLNNIWTILQNQSFSWANLE